ncbi:MAG: flagellin [Cyanobacteria bacterium P01_H01_bin.74]
MLYSDIATTLQLNRQLGITNNRLSRTMQRLSTGLRINQASDGAAALMISETMNAQIRGFDMATSNVQQGISMLNTADGGLQQITQSLQRIREIGVLASNGTTSTAQFSAYQAELQQELANIDAISASTRFGDNVLLDGSISGGAAFNIQAGPNTTDGIDIRSAFGNNVSGAGGLAITQNTLTSTANATTLINQVDAALTTVSTNTATIGGFQNRLQNQADYLSTARVNVTAAQTSLIGADIALETANLAQYQILQQAGAFAFSQNTLSGNVVLGLLQ